MPTLISGSFAFDTILVFPDRFKNHILPEKVHVLNVSFLVPTMRQEFGGTAGNIAYNLKLLGGEPLPMGTVGMDFGPYAEWLDRHGIPRTYVREVPDRYTARAFITTDEDDNQITAFHPGAMAEAHLQSVADVEEPIDWGIVSPNDKQAMVKHAREFRELKIPFIFDPGQGLPLFEGEELDRILQKDCILAVNDYECEMVLKKMKISTVDLAERVRALVVTRGGKGSEIYADGDCLHVDALPVARIVDPTGCGDAYRAGLLFGLARGFDWELTAQIASTMGAYKIESSGPQRHRFELDALKQRMKAVFGRSF